MLQPSRGRWFADLAASSAATRGLVEALDLFVHGVDGPAEAGSCEVVLLTAAGRCSSGHEPRARCGRTCPPADLLAAIAAATPDPASARHLMGLVLDGATRTPPAS